MIAVFVGGRSDGGILEPLIKALGATVIEAEIVPEDTPLAIAESSYRTSVKVAYDLEADMLVVLGDRFEALAAAEAAYNMGVPVCHLHGGEVTLGSRDDARRKAITCLSDLHLVSSPKAARNVRKLGAKDVRVIGAIGAYSASQAKYVDRGYPYIIAAVPAEPETARAVTHALSLLEKKANVTIGPNGDLGKSQLEGVTLPPAEFLSHLRSANVIVGNTSAGIIEAPSAGTWTVNVGDRQKGRESCESVIHVPAEPSEIAEAVLHCITTPFPDVDNPYDRGDSVSRAVEAICEATGHSPTSEASPSLSSSSPT